jgi:hypothetical protein
VELRRFYLFIAKNFPLFDCGWGWQWLVARGTGLLSLKKAANAKLQHQKGYHYLDACDPGRPYGSQRRIQKQSRG